MAPTQRWRPCLFSNNVVPRDSLRLPSRSSCSSLRQLLGAKLWDEGRRHGQTFIGGDERNSVRVATSYWQVTRRRDATCDLQWLEVCRDGYRSFLSDALYRFHHSLYMCHFILRTAFYGIGPIRIETVIMAVPCIGVAYTRKWSIYACIKTLTVQYRAFNINVT